MKLYRTVKLVLQDDNGDILLIRRSETHPTLALDMDLPGGEIEQTETPESALVREINEEIGLDLSQAEFKLIYASTMPHEGVIAIRLVYYLRTSEKPKIHLSWEHDQSLWCSVVEAEKLLPRGKYKQQALAFLLENKVIEDL